MSVTAPKGWRASAVVAGTKDSGDPDLALVVSDYPASVAGAFTTNQVQGGHVHICRPRVAGGSVRGVVVSAGISNSGTGAPGVEDARRMAAMAAEAAGVPEEEMLVCSTGTIGTRIPLDRIERAVGPAAKALSADGGDAAARAIMTTDTRPKVGVRAVDGVTMGAMCKGAGMISPAMKVAQATMLAFITSDAAASPAWLREVLEGGLGSTFNALTIDGSTSTCDTVLLFANGASGVDVDGSERFAQAVHEVMGELAYAIAADGEGATKVIRIRVSGADTDADAATAARAVASSLLFRAAIWGGDPNWGRVAQSIGQTSVRFDPGRLRVEIAGVEMAVDGLETGREAEAAAGLVTNEVLVHAELGQGDGSFEILTCDLTPDYVKFNADYKT